ncbi:MAG: ketosteroid isomerase family protein [Coleofasciculus sp.]|uniref:ketosteroid isomerase family protein n=1 Tax=Coleofasciculus sp. TaxID=3100458 RepID=UPI003A3353BA
MTIEGITQSVILHYFETMNAGDYDATAALFTDNGVMQPPFEELIQGQYAIATYLKAEAIDMQLLPKTGIVEPQENGETQIQVKGRVQTPLFSVNVGWIFILNLEQRISFVRIKLLASPQELLSLRR